jgi:hyaluronoglucosaminidase
VRRVSGRSPAFARRGVVEGFFGPPWSMAARRRLFAFGATRGMNTYLYAPKDDPYHRARWTEPYPRAAWRALARLIAAARRQRIDFVYGFHPGAGLRFGAAAPVKTLLAKATRFYDEGVRTFAVLFDDIPSRLEHAADCRRFGNSLARAEGRWLAEILAHQSTAWRDVEWWICPSYYSPDPRLARIFGAFERDFLETLAEALPQEVACFWTGPAIVPDRITFAHVRAIAARLRHRLILWDNYPVNDLSMADELHIGPLAGRDPQLPRTVYGYLNNPLLQPDLGLVPLATCFDYAADPAAYRPEASWTAAVIERFGARALPHWRAIRAFDEASLAAKRAGRPLRISPQSRFRLRAAGRYAARHRGERWALELAPWRAAIDAALQID